MKYIIFKYFISIFLIRFCCYKEENKMRKIAINTLFITGCICSFCLFYMAAAGIDRVFLNAIK